MARRGRPRRGGEGWLIAGGIAMGAIALVGFGWLYSIYREGTENLVTLTPSTLCPVNGPRAFTAVLIDRTDAISEVSRADVAVKLHDLLDLVPRYGQLELFSITATVKVPMAAELSKCNPGQGKYVDPMTGAPEMVQKTFASQFQAPLDSALSQMLALNEAPASPIMEAIQAVAVSSFSGEARRDRPKKLIIVSDLLQHSPNFSQYRDRAATFAQFQKSAGYKAVAADIRGVDVEILYLQRATQHGLQTDDHIRFWRDYFAAQGVDNLHFVKVAGLN